MATSGPRPGVGLYPDGMTSHALCLRCGDCVAACEGTTSRFDVETPLRLGWLRGEPDVEIGSALPQSPKVQSAERPAACEPRERAG